MFKTFTAALVALSVTVSLAATPEVAFAGPKKKTTKYQKPVKMLIGAIRYNKDKLALKMLALDDMSKGLMTKHWAKMSPAVQKEFVAGLATLLSRLSFPKARDMFKHIDAILYDPPKVKGDKVDLKSTIVVHRSYKKTELVLTWTLIKKGKKWLIYDVTSVGESTLAGIRDDQINPLVKEGGIKLLMEKMRAKVKEVTQK